MFLVLLLLSANSSGIIASTTTGAIMSTYLERLRARELENVKLACETVDDDENINENDADDAIFIQQAIGEGDGKNSVKCEN
jgi:hypothetical protein